MRTITLEIKVRVPNATGENEVETAINAALDENHETGLRWGGDWEVEQAVVINADRL